MVIDLQIDVPQSAQYLPGDVADLYTNRGGGSAINENLIVATVDLWPGQDLGLTDDEMPIGGGSADGGAENRYTEDNSVEDASTIDQPAGTVGTVIADIGPGMFSAKVRTRDLWGNSDEATYNHFVCTPPHEPSGLVFDRKETGRFFFTFNPSRSL